jgi:hypothetical protein
LAILTLFGLAPGTGSIDFSSSAPVGFESQFDRREHSERKRNSHSPRTVPTPEPSFLVLLIAGMSLLVLNFLRRT